MQIRTLISVLILGFSSFAWSAQCLVSMALQDPELSQNAAFWEDYAKLSGQGQTSDAQMQSLIEKYRPGSKSTTSDSSKNEFKTTATYRVQAKAEKEIKSLPKNLQTKVDEFMEIATKPGGLQDLRNNPGRWHLEKLAEFGDKAYSVRLNDGYRVLFDFEKNDNHFEIRRVNKGQIHGD